MGIDKSHFVDPNYKLFICFKCGDVAREPVVTTCCEDCFCSSCFATTLLDENGTKCTNCHDTYLEGKTKKLQRQLGLIYLKLRMKCDESTCTEVLTVQNFDEHIQNCSNKPFDCTKCGMEGKQPDKDTHDCLQWLKDENRRLINENKTLKSDVKSLKSEVECSENDKQDNQIEIDSLKSRIRNLEVKSKPSRQRSGSRVRIDGNADATIQELQDQIKTAKRRLSESYAQRDVLEKQLNQALSENGGLVHDYGRMTPGSNGSRDGPNSGLIAPKVIFDKAKTKASDVVMRFLINVINLAESKNKTGLLKYAFINRGLQMKLGGQWISMDANEYNPAKASITPDTFCWYTYDGSKHVTFQRLKF